MRKHLFITLAALLFIVSAASAQLTPQMSAGIPGAKYVPAYSISEREAAARNALKLAWLFKLGKPITLAPDSPYARDGSHLSIWKPSFVLATPSGGEVGINFWGIYNQGHVNVGFTAKPAQRYLLDCRLIATGNVTYKIYAGSGALPWAAGEMSLSDGHLFVIVDQPQGGPISVEIWPTPTNVPSGFLGCEISAMK